MCCEEGVSGKRFGGVVGSVAVCCVRMPIPRRYMFPLKQLLVDGTSTTMLVLSITRRYILTQQSGLWVLSGFFVKWPR